jgi:hypothetical protein
MEQEIKGGDANEIQKQLEKETEDLLEEIIQFIFTASQQNIVKNNSFGVTGNLFGDAEIIRGRLTRSIIYKAFYADFIEFGTGPHPISSEVLVEWCEKKFGLSEEDAKHVAFLVARKIRTKGIEAKPFGRPALNAAKERYG